MKPHTHNIMHFFNSYFGGLNIVATKPGSTKENIKVLEEILTDLPLMETRHELTRTFQINAFTVTPRHNIFMMGQTDTPTPLKGSGCTPSGAVHNLWNRLEKALYYNKLLWLDGEDLCIWQDYKWQPAPDDVSEQFYRHKR